MGLPWDEAIGDNGRLPRPRRGFIKFVRGYLWKFLFKVFAGKLSPDDFDVEM